MKVWVWELTILTTQLCSLNRAFMHRNISEMWEPRSIETWHRTSYCAKGVFWLKWIQIPLLWSIPALTVDMLGLERFRLAGSEFVDGPLHLGEEKKGLTQIVLSCSSRDCQQTRVYVQLRCSGWWESTEREMARQWQGLRIGQVDDRQMSLWSDGPIPQECATNIRSGGRRAHLKFRGHSAHPNLIPTCRNYHMYYFWKVTEVRR